MDLRGRRVTVMGLGRQGGGVAAARYAADHGAIVTVTDLADETALEGSLAQLAGVPIHGFALGGHQLPDFRQAELVVANPAVPPGDSFLDLARGSGARITTEIELLIDACPAPVIAVTGSNGKSSTAAMIAAILQADGRHCFLGGNIGVSLLPQLDRITRRSTVVLELSSFQIARLPRRIQATSRGGWPAVGVVTNCTPNHLDWHGTLAAYTAAKQALLAMQDQQGLAVLNLFDRQVAKWVPLVRGKRLATVPLDTIPPLAVPGEHNRISAALAATVARGVGCCAESIERGLAAFRGLPYRLDPAGRVAGRRFIDDSAATTPEAAIAALQALAGRTWLLAGGHDKGTGFTDLARAIARRACGACFYGAARDKLRRQLTGLGTGLPHECRVTLAEAVHWCWHRSRPGDCLLLSPACASHDQFRDCAHRAAAFRQIIRTLGRRHDRPPVRRAARATPEGLA